MLGISYGELFVIVGFAAAVIGPKDLPLIARTAGRFAGRAIGYVQMARVQFENIMQNPEVGKMYKELQDTHAQLAAIRHELHGLSSLNSNALFRGQDRAHQPSVIGAEAPEKPVEDGKPLMTMAKEFKIENVTSSLLHSQATARAHVAEIPNIKLDSHSKYGGNERKLNAAADGLVAGLAEIPILDSSQSCGNEQTGDARDGLVTILPVSAEVAGLIPKSDDTKPVETTGSDVLLQALLEAEVAHKAKDYFAQAENQFPKA